MKAWIGLVLLGLLLCVGVMNADAYQLEIEKVNTGWTGPDVWIKWPEINSTIAKNASFSVICYSETNITVTAWDQGYAVKAGTMKEFKLIVGNYSDEINVTSGNGTVLASRLVRVAEPSVIPAVVPSKPTIEKVYDKIYSPTFWILMGSVAIALGAGIAFAMVKATKQISPVSIVTGTTTLIGILGIILGAVYTDHYDGSWFYYSAWAYLCGMQIIGGFCGVVFGRFALGPFKIKIVDEKNKAIKNTEIVYYKNDAGINCAALQGLKYALEILRGKDRPVLLMYEVGIMRQDWTEYPDFSPKYEFMFASDFKIFEDTMGEDGKLVPAHVEVYSTANYKTRVEAMKRRGEAKNDPVEPLARKVPAIGPVAAADEPAKKIVPVMVAPKARVPKNAEVNTTWGNVFHAIRCTDRTTSEDDRKDHCDYTRTLEVLVAKLRKEVRFWYQKAAMNRTLALKDGFSEVCDGALDQLWGPSPLDDEQLRSMEADILSAEKEFDESIQAQRKEAEADRRSMNSRPVPDVERERQKVQAGVGR